MAAELARPADAIAIAQLRVDAARELTSRHGRGHWSAEVSESSVARAIEASTTLVARDQGEVVATLRLITKKPWAIDRSYFAACTRPLYLVDMAVAPSRQRQGWGRRLLLDAVAVAREWPADAIRLDGYDSDAGAGGFYADCGFTEVGRALYRGVPLIYYEMLL